MRILKDMKILNLLLIVLFPFFVNVEGVNAQGKAYDYPFNAPSAKDDVSAKEDKKSRNPVTCKGKVEKMKWCCSAEGVLSCLAANAKDKESAKDNETLNWISKYVGGGAGALGLAGGATLAGSSMKKMCGFLEKVSYAYTGFNAIAVSYCGWLIMDASSTCDKDLENANRIVSSLNSRKKHLENKNEELTDPDKQLLTQAQAEVTALKADLAEYDKHSGPAKKEILYYMAKIGAGVYSAYKTKKCKKELHDSSGAVANTNNSLSKPAHCTTGLMVSYDPECSGYCFRVNNEDPVCQNLPTLPNNQRSVASPYRPSRIDNSGLHSRNRLFQAKADAEKQRKLVQKKIERNKTYVNRTFKDLDEKMNQRLKALNKRR